MLEQVIFDGASRHRLSKGFIVLHSDYSEGSATLRERLLAMTNGALAAQPGLTGFVAEARPEHPSLIGLRTPFLPVYGIAQRDSFIIRLEKATRCLIQAAAHVSCRLAAAGVNPFAQSADGQIPSLCADLHQIEVFDEGEIERVYNLYRQFLPELLAISTHAAVYGGTVQKDFSLRMRIDPASFLPRYISQFSARHLDRLRRMMRKDYGLADLTQMDVNPLAGDPARLAQENAPLLVQEPAAAELRFVDAQIAYPFIRAQIILFQAISIYGRTLARAGKRLPYMRDNVIDENKALALQGGPGAMLKPDEKFKKNEGGRGYWYHDKGLSERATTALLTILEGLLLPSLRTLDCQYREIAPIVLGAELRRRGCRCLANYGEYQKYLFFTYTGRFTSVFEHQANEALAAKDLDYITDYNHRSYSDLAGAIESDWNEKLRPRPRRKGRVQWYDVRRREGLLATEEGQEIRVEQRDLEGIEGLASGQIVSFELLEKGRPKAIRVRMEKPPARAHGRVVRFDSGKGFGFIKIRDKGEVFFHQSDVLDGSRLIPGDAVSCDLTEGHRGLRAVRIDIERGARQEGIVKWFNPEKGFGFITVPGDADIFVHKDDVEKGSVLQEAQRVSFETAQSAKGAKAVRVRPLPEEV